MFSPALTFGALERNFGVAAKSFKKYIGQFILTKMPNTAKRAPKDIEDLLVDNAASSSLDGKRSYIIPPKQKRKLRPVNRSPSPPNNKTDGSVGPTKPKVSKMTIGNATIIKCPIVEENNPTIEANIKQELKSEIKTEPSEERDENTVIEMKIVPKVEIKTDPDATTDPFNLGEKAPKNWWQQLENIRIMRAKSDAPVDTMGCHRCADENVDEKTQRFHKLVALMLSSQTKDETTYQAMMRLKLRTLTPSSIIEFPVTDLEQLLHPVSFYKNKAKYLKETAQVLVDKYNSDIPKNVKELIALPGVGPKMAHIAMATAWNEVTGIGVDVHVHRISNRLKWSNNTQQPEKTRVALEGWLPRELWPEVNHLLVGFGQTICTPTKPQCGQCLNSDICPSVDKSSTKKKVK